MKSLHIAIIACITIAVSLPPAAAEENKTAAIGRYCQTWTGSHFGNNSKKAGQAAMAEMMGWTVK